MPFFKSKHDKKVKVLLDESSFEYFIWKESRGKGKKEERRWNNQMKRNLLFEC
jgi:hypothetical protein